MSLYDINCLALNFLIICSFILILEHLFSSSGCLEYRKLSDKCYLTFFNLHIIKSAELNSFNLSSYTSLNKVFLMSSNSVEKIPFSKRHSLSLFYKKNFLRIDPFEGFRILLSPLIYTKVRHVKSYRGKHR